MCDTCRAAIALWSPEKLNDEVERILELAELATSIPGAHVVATGTAAGSAVPSPRRQVSHAQ